jgi:ArsR family transcriptional regulator
MNPRTCDVGGESGRTPLVAAVIDEPAALDLATAFKALADHVRLRLLSMIAAAPNGTACRCDLEARSARVSRPCLTTSRCSPMPA